MKEQSNFSHKHEHVQQSAHAHAAKEFSSSDELLRSDAAHTVVPPEIAERLKKSAASIPPPERPRSWWKNLFGS